MEAKMDVTRGMTYRIYPDTVRPSSWVLVLFLLLVPFDSYLGEMISIPVIVPLMLLFCLVKFVENLACRSRISCNIVVLFGLFVCASSVPAVLKYGLTYNIELYFTMFFMYVLLSSTTYSKREIETFIRTAPYVALLFILVTTRHIVYAYGEVYFYIKEIVDPNYFITSMVFVVACLMYLTFKPGRRYLKAIYIAEMLVIVVYTLLIGTRGGLLAILTVILFGMLVASKQPVKLLVTFAVAAFVLLAFAKAFVPQDMLSRFTLKNMLSSGGSGRTTIWKNYLSIYSSGNPLQLLFGFGKDVPPKIYLESFGRGYYAHNLYVKELVEGGIVGLALFLYLCLKTLVTAKRRKNGLVFCAFAGFLVGSLFLDMDNMRIYWILMFFAYMRTEDGRLIMWRNKYGFQHSNSDL